MIFKFNQTVLHGTQRFEKDSQDVPMEFMHYFAMNGWVDPVDAEAQQRVVYWRGDAPEGIVYDTPLNVDNVHIGVTSEIANG